MKKSILTFLLVSSMAFVYGQSLTVKNNTSHTIKVQIWAVTLPDCSPGMPLLEVVIPSMGIHTEIAPPPSLSWGRVVVQAGGTGAIGNPTTCADINTVGGGINGTWSSGCVNCDAAVIFSE